MPNSPNPLAVYLRDIRNTRNTGMGQPETSYYGALKDLLDSVGAGLKPKVRCIVQLANAGGGSPDIGLFTPDQIQAQAALPLLHGQIPSRGVVEVKKAKDDAWLTADGEQVTRYWGHYRQVLVTNLRDFLLVGTDRGGNPVKLESFRLASSEAAFWQTASHPEAVVEERGEAFLEFLKRVMGYQATLQAPQDVAWFLASYARDARIRIEGADLPALTDLRLALEAGLGLTFEGAKGEHFFRSTLIQTLFYGMFSAWLLWRRRNTARGSAQFDWRSAAWELKVPMVQALFHQLTDPAKLAPLGLEEVLDWGAAVLDRVDFDKFSVNFEAAYAVQYFYEPFLQAFDPALRKELGVWYTPPEIVKYMVARVDLVLRQELGVLDGLADKNVYVLDLAVGTASYLVETLRSVYASAKDRYGDALASQIVKEAALERVYGFEILPAPFVVAHLQLGLLLEGLGAPLSPSGNERAHVYLTNSLTGWEPPKGPNQHLLFPEIERERDAADNVKRDVPILVILGNPPYNGFAGVSTNEEGGLLEPYKQNLADWGITKNYLDDLYVRFFRIAQRRIAEGMQRGVVCYISNHSYLEDPSYVVMRQHLLHGFDTVWVDEMNGDSRETGKTTPEGKPDPSVFSTPFNKAGIRVGTAITLWVKRGTPSGEPHVRFREFWGTEKRASLLASLQAKPFGADYREHHPKKSNWYALRPWLVADGWDEWPQVSQLPAISPMLGLNENRGGALSDMDKTVLAGRMSAYFDRTVPFGDPSLPRGLVENAARFDAEAVRGGLLTNSAYADAKLRRFWSKPFDLRWAYLEPAAKLWNEGRGALLSHATEDGEFLLIRRRAPRARDGAAFFYSRHLADQHALDTDAYFIPLQLGTGAGRKKAGAQTAFPSLGLSESRPNLSALAKTYLKSVGISDPDLDGEAAELLWMHVLACGYAPTYVAENASGLKTDWPHVPLPNSESYLRGSAHLGRTVASLLDVEREVLGVSGGTLRDELRLIGPIERQADSKGALDLEIRATWGYLGQRSIVMPGNQELRPRDYNAQELAALEAGAASLGISLEDLLDRLGSRTYDVPLNETTAWSNVPERVWGYSIGGHQVLKKWLSYRTRAVLGRDLTLNEALDFLQAARRLAAILIIEPALDDSYALAKSNCWTKSTSGVP